MLSSTSGISIGSLSTKQKKRSYSGGVIISKIVVAVEDKEVSNVSFIFHLPPRLISLSSYNLNCYGEI